jgi:hypothetical protein
MLHRKKADIYISIFGKMPTKTQQLAKKTAKTVN